MVGQNGWPKILYSARDESLFCTYIVHIFIFEVTLIKCFGLLFVESEGASEVKE